MIFFEGVYRYESGCHGPLGDLASTLLVIPIRPRGLDIVMQFDFRNPASSEQLTPSLVGLNLLGDREGQTFFFHDENPASATEITMHRRAHARVFRLWGEIAMYSNQWRKILCQI